MMLTYAAILISVAIVGVSWHMHFKSIGVDTYHYTYIGALNFNETNCSITSEEQDDMDTTQFFYKHIIEDEYLGESVKGRLSEFHENIISYQELLEMVARDYVDSLIRNSSNTIVKSDREKICALFHEYACEHENVAKSCQEGEQSVVHGRRREDQSRQLQNIMLRTVKTFTKSKKAFLYKLTDILARSKSKTYQDLNFSKSHMKVISTEICFLASFTRDLENYKFTEFLTKLSNNLRTTDFNHFLLDFTSICVESFTLEIRELKKLNGIEQSRRIRIYKKRITENLVKILVSVFDKIAEIELCNNQRFTILLDVISILEFAAIRNNVDYDYNFISDITRDILVCLGICAKTMREKHGNFTVEVLGINDLIKLKLYSHTSTPNMFKRIEEHIKTNTSADPDKIVEVRKLINFDKPSRWCFEGLLFDSLVGTGNDTLAASDVDTLLTFYNEKSRLIIDTCFECKGKKADFCDNCEKLKCHFGHICILYKHYKDLLEGKNRLTYYQNIDEFVKYGKEDEEEELEQKRQKLMEMMSANVTKKPQKHSNIGECAKSGVTIATKSREYRRGTHQNLKKKKNC